MTLILGIETSCDETAAAVVRDGRHILSNVVASQVALHAPYGGVFPEVASRAHIEVIGAVVRQAMEEAAVGYDALDAIAVTRGPGLAGSLLVGVNFAKGLAFGQGLPLVGVNHLEGHIYSLWLTEAAEQITFPVVVLIVSGGHSELVLVRDHGQYEHLGGTQDDAAGEAFDKVARLLRLGYPGGPAIQKAAEGGNPHAYDFPKARTDAPYDFSFSGLKTAVLREATVQAGGALPHQRVEEREAPLRRDIRINDMAASFQQAVVDALVEKTVRAAREFGATAVLLAGGVSANRALRETVRRQAELPVYYPPLHLCTDNAAMIATAGYFRFIQGQRDSLDMDVQPMWPLISLKPMSPAASPA
ncbi:MAG: tRNA (adenosine(37)-N6)-threonylcarbamoyltransferase complex transferase subunit TsaD [Anaerolineae bacterium]|nr:tRNA (adenosine(37)-N6)-threonylcarbamoyltransferase complex transferase subunit TsaD [Anaerolineae bacterium]